jgi:hypothetical protein
VLVAACSADVSTGPGTSTARTITIRDVTGLTQIVRLNRTDLRSYDSLIVEVVGRNEGRDSVSAWRRICEAAADVDPVDLQWSGVRCFVADALVRLGPRDSVYQRTAYLVLPRQDTDTSRILIHMPQEHPLDIASVVTLRPPALPAP